MNGRILQLNNSEHRTVRALLPWFVVDTLTAEELALVQAHVLGCTQCQADLDWQRKLLAVEPRSNANPDVERAFAKLRPRLDTTQRGSKRRVLIEFLNNFWHGNPQWMRWTLVAQFSVILALTFMLATPYGNVVAYRALGIAKNAGGNAVVVFNPETSEQDLRRILQDAGAHIVDGPTVTDAYLLNVPKDKLSAAIHVLRSHRAVVLAESLGSGDDR